MSFLPGLTTTLSHFRYNRKEFSTPIGDIFSTFSSSPRRPLIFFSSSRVNFYSLSFSLRAYLSINNSISFFSYVCLLFLPLSFSFFIRLFILLRYLRILTFPSIFIASLNLIWNFLLPFRPNLFLFSFTDYLQDNACRRAWKGILSNVTIMLLELKPTIHIMYVYFFVWNLHLHTHNTRLYTRPYNLIHTFINASISRRAQFKGNRHMKSNQWSEFNSWMRLSAFHFRLMSLRKVPIYLISPQAICKEKSILGSSALVKH